MDTDLLLIDEELYFDSLNDGGSSKEIKRLTAEAAVDELYCACLENKHRCVSFAPDRGELETLSGVIVAVMKDYKSLTVKYKIKADGTGRFYRKSYDSPTLKLLDGYTHGKPRTVENTRLHGVSTLEASEEATREYIGNVGKLARVKLMEGGEITCRITGLRYHSKRGEKSYSLTTADRGGKLIVRAVNSDNLTILGCDELTDGFRKRFEESRRKFHLGNSDGIEAEFRAAVELLEIRKKKLEDAREAFDEARKAVDVLRDKMADML